MTVDEGLRARLIADSGVSAIVGSRIWWQRIPPNGFDSGVTQPGITFLRISANRTVGIGDTAVIAQPRFQISIWAKTGEDILNLSNAVRLCLYGFRGVLGSSIPVSIDLVGERDLDEPDLGLFHRAMDFTVFHSETNTYS